MSTSDSTQTTTYPVEFSGKGGEFFGIWIVNLLLSIITLGIYGAWAKVRTNQYFYGHTKINGHGFRYLATPIQILIGRIIALAFFVVYIVVSYASPAIALLLALLFVFISPWIIVQGLKFNMRMTSYRNVRFSFTGSYGDALINFTILPILSLFTFYLIFPWVLQRIHTFIYGNIRFGGKPLNIQLSTKEYYLASLIALVATIVVYFVIGVILAALGFSTDMLLLSAEGGAGFGGLMVLGLVLVMLLYWIGFTFVGALFQSKIRNHILQSSEIQEVASFNSSMRPIPFAGLMLTNALIIIFTFGFGYPFAKIRKAAYLAQATEVNLQPKAAEVIDSIEEGASSIGDEAAGFFDLDISIT